MDQEAKRICFFHYRRWSDHPEVEAAAERLIEHLLLGMRTSRKDRNHLVELLKQWAMTFVEAVRGGVPVGVSLDRNHKTYRLYSYRLQKLVLARLQEEGLAQVTLGSKEAHKVTEVALTEAGRRLFAEVPMWAEIRANYSDWDKLQFKDRMGSLLAYPKSERRWKQVKQLKAWEQLNAPYKVALECTWGDLVEVKKTELESLFACIPSASVVVAYSFFSLSSPISALFPTSSSLSIRKTEITKRGLAGLTLAFAETPEFERFRHEKLSFLIRTDDLHRIFNWSKWNLGGRIYTQVQQVPRVLRPHLCIDGEPTGAVDFDGMQLYQLHHLHGAQPPEYLYDLCPAVPGSRKGFKFAYITAANARTKGDGLGSIQHQLETEEKYAPLFEAGFDAKMIDALFREHYPAIYPYLYKAVGLHLQYLESEITLDVMEQFRRRNLPILTVHDEAITMASHAAELAAVMEATYLRHTGSPITTKISSLVSVTQ